HLSLRHLPARARGDPHRREAREGQMISRRGFLQGAGAGLVIGFYIPQVVRAAPQPQKAPPPLPQANAFLRIGSDDSVTVLLAPPEMGQGIWTGLPMLIAEELDCDWSKMRVEHAPAAPVYGHPRMGMQMTGGSSSTNGEFARYREVGAVARDMLVRAAAARWKVSPAACKVQNGVITYGKEKLTFGQVADEAMKLAPPGKVTLKPAKDWKLIGTPQRRLDTPEKITGKAVFGMDIHFPGLRTAVVARPPAFGSRMVKFDAARALKVPGVEKVVPTANGVAVVASNFWAAKTGRELLGVEGSKPEEPVDTPRQMAEYRETSKKPGAIVTEAGKVTDALAGASKRHEAVYEVPYLAHAPMEPLNATAKIDGDRVEIWAGTQFQTMDRMIPPKIVCTTP